MHCCLGLHSQTQAIYSYYYGNEINSDGDLITYNKDGIRLVKSFHSVISYDRLLGSVSRLKDEIYYQHLYDLPVASSGSSFSHINSGAGFSKFFPEQLTNDGNARNYGVELTLERFFSGGYYFLLTGYLFDSKYKTLENVWRTTSFN